MNSIVLVCSFVLAALEPLSPVGGKSVALVPDAQKRVMAPEKVADRIKVLQTDRAGDKRIKHDKLWKKSLPFVLELKATDGEKGPWKVLLGKQPDLSDARTIYLREAKIKDGVVRIELPRANLEIGTHYWWKAVSWGRCGSSCPPNHTCEPRKRRAETPVSDFVTEDVAPRWIALAGEVANVRDLGGRIGLNGRRVRQGMVFRGQGLNSNSATGEAPGPSRLTVEDVRTLTETLGVRTDLDLRTKGEIVDMTVSPLGPSVRFVNHSSATYRDIFKSYNKATMAKNVRVFCDRANYPVYFHCIAGADRTGALAYMLLGALGVSQHDAETDWESTFYPTIPDEDASRNDREALFLEGLSKYGGADASWNDRVVLYLKDCGITDAELAALREILLEDAKR